MEVRHMTPSVPASEELPGDIQFRGSTVSDETVTEPDTQVVVTDEIIAVYPNPGVNPDSPIEFMFSLNEPLRVRCEGYICRTVMLKTITSMYELSAVTLNEMKFRQAIIETADLVNDATRLNLDRIGICPCWTGVFAGAVLSIVGFASVLTVAGASLGALLLGFGLGLLGLTYVARKFGKYRGANIWERKPTGTGGRA